MKSQPFTYNGFSGGVNTLRPARDIEDHEVTEAINFELYQRSVMRVRNGLTALATGLNGPVTSILHYRMSGGLETVVFTGGTKIYRMPVGGGAVTDVTGGLTLPSSGPWQWVVMGDKAIGVNRSTTAANPVVLDSTSDTAAAALGGSPPKALYAEVFNSRLFLVSATEPNRLYYSALGAPEDWTTTGKAGSGSILVGGNEGDYITGVKAHLGRLFIFKRTRVYVLVPGSPNTDNQQWVVQMLTDRVGCVAGYSVQPVLNDLVFLSDHGVMSLQAVQQVGDFKHAVLSHKVTALREFNKSVVGLASVNHSDRLQYWIAVPELAGDSVNTSTWVMDYTDLSSGSVAWTQFTGGVVGTAYGQVYESGTPKVYVGSATGLYRYGDAGVFDDAGTIYDKTLLTKAYSPGPALWRKEFLKYGVEFETETDDGDVTLSYRLDESDSLMKTVHVRFGSAFSGGRWDEGDWDSATYATAASRAQEFLSRFVGTVGRRGQVVQFRFYNEYADGFQVKRLTLDASILTRNHSGDLLLPIPLA